MDKIFKIGLLIFAILVTIVPASTMATDIFNYGQRWKTWSVNTRSVYLEGFLDGSFYVYFTAGNEWLPGELFKNPLPQEVQKVHDKIFFFMKPSAIRDVMTNLYEDPANTFIKFETLLYLARNKIIGKDISGGLIGARKVAIEEWEFLRKVESE